MKTILDTLVKATRLRLARDKQAIPEGEMRRLAMAARKDAAPFRFHSALAAPGMQFICEVKKASPSKGLIAPDFVPLQTAREYEAAGAAAVSVLTEPDYFLGSDEYLRDISAALAIPTLRKDFIVDAYQITQAAALGASAVLLICAILDDAALASLIKEAHGLGLDAMVEAHDEEEVGRALNAGADILGINNRNLKTFEVDTATSTRLRGMVPPEVLFVSESGITTAADVEALRGAGVDALLVGESLMRSGNKAAAIAALRGR